MLSMRELRSLARGLKLAEFKRQLGPFALIQKPPDEFVRRQALALGAKKTVMAKSRGGDETSLLLELENLAVATLPPIEAGGDQLTVGRLPDCELVVDDPAVSKRHATIYWSTEERNASVEDLKSSNGTLLNGGELLAPTPLQDGDELTFGDSRFVFLLAETLYGRLLKR
jgi:pSer/pThr/pTyr-binding forkhead associated (FHA) protein